MQFEDQGGMSGMDPSPLVRWIGSKFMTRMASESRVAARRSRLERARRKSGDPHLIEYFHQPGDGYSQLAVQLLEPLVAGYDVKLVCHLVAEEDGRNLPEPDLLRRLSQYDSAVVAPHYGLTFPRSPGVPDAELVALAASILAAAPAELFVERALAVGQLLHECDRLALVNLGEQLGRAADATTAECLARGNARRSKLGHYSGGMFYYAGEWYWGADRFYHLENRLRELGACRNTDEALVCPRPEIEMGPGRDDGSLTLEIYPSLRSPYTAVIFDTVVQLAEQTGVRLSVRPVLPMVMRGVPATRQKGAYIIADAAREARTLGVDWGQKVYDPIGQPVRNAYSLYPWAAAEGRGSALLSSFMRAAFVKGVNTAREKGLQYVVERAGLSWADAATRLGDPAWQRLLEENRLAMYEFGSWGVPSFRLLDRDGEEALALWGQDRLWLFSREIQRLLQ